MISDTYVMTIEDVKKIIKESFDLKFFEEDNNKLLYVTSGGIIVQFDLFNLRNLTFDYKNYHTENFGLNYYEILISAENDIDKNIYNKWIKDERINIDYKIGNPSYEYLFYFLQYINPELRELIRFTSIVIFSDIVKKPFVGHDFMDEILKLNPFLLELKTISILSHDKNIDKDKLRTLSNSFIYELSRSNNIVRKLKKFDEYMNYVKIKDIEYTIDVRNRNYNNELLLYYSNAVSSISLKDKYLSFYHTLEYFLNNNIQEDLENELNYNINLINNYDNLDSILNNIKTIKNILISKKDIRDEEKKIRIVLYNNIKENDINIIKAKLNIIDENLIDYYKNEKVKFNDKEDGEKIDLDNFHNEYFFNNLANRIYKIRNALVHSKEKEKFKYTMFKDDEILIKEIYLIRYISERIIENTAEEIIID